MSKSHRLIAISSPTSVAYEVSGVGRGGPLMVTSCNSSVISSVDSAWDGGAGAGVAGPVPAAAGQGVHHAVGHAGRHGADLDALLPRHPPRQLLAVRLQLLAGRRQRGAVLPRLPLPASRAARGRLTRGCVARGSAGRCRRR